MENDDQSFMIGGCMEFRNYYNRPRSVGEVIKGKSLTQQSAKGECDINKIIAKYRSTGIVSHVSGKRPLWGDFAAVGNFQQVQEKVLLAQESFEQLSSVVRRRFNNDPAEFMEFVQNPENKAEAEALGLIEKPPTEPSAPRPKEGEPPAAAVAESDSTASEKPSKPAKAGKSAQSST